MKRPTSVTSKILCVFALTSVFSCNQQQDKIMVKAPNQIVAVPQAKNMYDSYGTRRVPLIQHFEDSINRQKKEGKEFDVGRFVYYDYETIKQYLVYIEQEAEDAGVEISTLRFYYSNYPDEAVFPNSKDSIKHPRQNSIMLSPTYNDGKRDFLFYVGQGAQGKQAVPLSNSFETIKGYGTNSSENSKAYASFAPNLNTTTSKSAIIQSVKSLTLNRGSGVPPPKN
ncbi:hypothetical protein [Maribacter sp. ACAM166]|uniref:hypothetical protein n=1 Tax=Maribacter sp. ACAM166 TaxID=2508996 RepID=UPI0010FF06A4|nr:hypothetical protein [Maribacter sp. ACAM166]TLP77042.1 hypothetical protein ES765_13550 [Maribacter sp. ACAM166]